MLSQLWVFSLSPLSLSSPRALWGGELSKQLCGAHLPAGLYLDKGQYKFGYFGNTDYMCSCCSETRTVWLKWTYFQVAFITLGTAGDVRSLVLQVISSCQGFSSSMPVTAQAETQYSLFLLSQSPIKKQSPSCSRAIHRLLELRSGIILLVFSLQFVDLSRLQDTCGEKIKTHKTLRGLFAVNRPLLPILEPHF